MKNYSTWSLQGCDFSAWNPIEDYAAAAKDNVDFVILKVIRRDGNPDKLFETHWEGFTSNNVVVQGVYNYSYATTVAEFEKDARNVLNILAGRKVMVWLDIENELLRNLGQTLIDGIKAYAAIITNAGLEFGVYTYVSFYNSYLKKYEDQLDYPFWIARYPSSENVDNDVMPNVMKCPDIGKRLYGWQYSSKGQVEGIKGNVDLNIWFVDIEATCFEERTETTTDAAEYINSGFRKEMAKLLGLNENASASDVLAKTVTISQNKNKNHTTVTALERLLKYHGYYTGEIEADLGKKPSFGNGMNKATYYYQANVVKLRKPDSEWTAKKNSYKKALSL